MKRIRTVLIGAGYRGQGLWKLLQSIDSYEVAGVFDPMITTLSSNACCFYAEGTDGYRQMIDDLCPDLVVIASPWCFHVEQALYALQQGCHVAIEIKGGLKIGEYEPLNELAERNALHIYPLENAVFMRENMAMLRMVREGVLGELVTLRGGYRHDLRDLLVDDEGNMGNPHKPEGVWRSRFYLQSNGDLYPTHGLAPLCLAAGVGRTDRITELTSFASRACGLNEYIRSKGGNAVLDIATGDIVVTQMRTATGVLITLTHDTTLPRPRSLDFEVQGTKGIWQGEHRRIYIEGLSPYESWEGDEKYVERYEHPFWKMWGEKAVETDKHHKGMDYIMLRTLAGDLQGECVYPMTGKDLAMWTSVTPYSIKSIAEKRTIYLP